MHALEKITTVELERLHGFLSKCAAETSDLRSYDFMLALVQAECSRRKDQARGVPAAPVRIDVTTLSSGLRTELGVLCVHLVRDIDPPFSRDVGLFCLAVTAAVGRVDAPERRN